MTFVDHTCASADDLCPNNYTCDTSANTCSCFIGYGPGGDDCSSSRSYQGNFLAFVLGVAALRCILILTSCSISIWNLSKPPGRVIAPAVKRTVLFILLSSTLQAFFYLFETCSALKLIKFGMHERLVLYLESFAFAAGLLPPATVFTVWIDLANATSARSKMKQQLRRSKRVVNFGVLGLLSALLSNVLLDQRRIIRLLHMFGVASILLMSMLGSNKLIKKLSSEGAHQASDKVEQTRVSVKAAADKMGMSAWYLLLGLCTISSSLTRVEGATNLYLVGATVRSVSEVTLLSEVYEYIQIFLRSTVSFEGSARTCASSLWTALTKFALHTKPALMVQEWEDKRHKNIGRKFRVTGKHKHKHKRGKVVPGDDEGQEEEEEDIDESTRRTITAFPGSESVNTTIARRYSSKNRHRRSTKRSSSVTEEVDRVTNQMLRTLSKAATGSAVKRRDSSSTWSESSSNSSRSTSTSSSSERDSVSLDGDEGALLEGGTASAAIAGRKGRGGEGGRRGQGEMGKFLSAAEIIRVVAIFQRQQRKALRDEQRKALRDEQQLVIQQRCPIEKLEEGVEEGVEEEDLEVDFIA